GGGENSIVIKNGSEVDQIVLASSNGKVSVKIDGNSNVGLIDVDNGSDDIVIEGSATEVLVEAEDIIVLATKGEIGSAKLQGKNSKLIVASDANINGIYIEKNAHKASIEVEGHVENLTVAAN